MFLPVFQNYICSLDFTIHWSSSLARMYGGRFSNLKRLNFDNNFSSKRPIIVIILCSIKICIE